MYDEKVNGSRGFNLFCYFASVTLICAFIVFFVKADSGRVYYLMPMSVVVVSLYGSISNLEAEKRSKRCTT